jgi:hypothetical protein
MRQPSAEPPPISPAGATAVPPVVSPATAASSAAVEPPSLPAGSVRGPTVERTAPSATVSPRGPRRRRRGAGARHALCARRAPRRRAPRRRGLARARGGPRRVDAVASSSPSTRSWPLTRGGRRRGRRRGDRRRGGGGGQLLAVLAVAPHASRAPRHRARRQRRGPRRWPGPRRRRGAGPRRGTARDAMGSPSTSRASTPAAGDRSALAVGVDVAGDGIAVDEELATTTSTAIPSTPTASTSAQLRVAGACAVRRRALGRARRDPRGPCRRARLRRSLQRALMLRHVCVPQDAPLPRSRRWDIGQPFAVERRRSGGRYRGGGHRARG